ncbi:MAG: RagB/SusD family nutrient uptake outer membrane protein [Prevotellaceae bacterium]|nr:RagB/SusD family nutrient uptake outer membrane protein [Prevotellaceae bacterium]
MKKIHIFLLCALWSAVACTEMDIPPKNIITDNDLLSNESGMEIYMARMYSYMPLEDFKYMGEWGFNFSSWLGATGIEGTGEALNRDGICKTFTGENTPYWGMAFTLLRDANHLIEALPEYQGSFAEPTYNHYLGEAYFVRATVFYAMAKRFGGVPLVTKVIEYPAKKEALEVPRASEEETWNQILADYDKAAELLMKTSPKRGYANKYVALTYKSEAMLYAGCVAKYNQTFTDRLTGFGQKTGVRVIGFAEDSWEAASKKYFAEAYKAARTVMTEGGYSLYKKKWAADNREAQYQNMVDMFSDLTSPENIYVREYIYPTVTHGYDAYSCPYVFRTVLAGGTCPTLDFVELFEGFPRYPDGTIKVTTGSSNTEGVYELYDTPLKFFENAEPRLRAYVIFPGDVFRNKEIEIRAGVYTGNEPISPLFSDYSYAAAETRYQLLDAYTKKNQTLYLDPNPSEQTIVTLPDATTMTAGGANGPWFNNGEGAMTGFYGRKWLHPNPPVDPGEGKSAQPFILMRYADVLLNAAEAAVELALAGEASPTGDDMLQVATDAIKAIQERAGVTQPTATLAGDEASRNIVRKERRKELAFEHKTKWDLRRWRVQHEDGRDYFWGEYKDKTTFGSSSSYRFRGLYPFYSVQSGKYFFDARFQWVALKTFGYNTVDYYFSIPGNEVTKSEYIDQQPNR